MVNPVLSTLESQITDKVNQIKDAETNRTFGEINIVNEVKIVEDGIAKIVFTPTSPYSPIAVNIGMEIKKAASGIPGLKKVIVLCQGHMQDDLVNKLVNQV